MEASPAVEISGEDVFEPLAASTPVKVLSRCIDLDDSDSDESLETPTKKRPLPDSRWLDLCDDGSPCKEASLRKENGNNQQREPMWVNFDDSTSFDENPVNLEQIDQNPVNVKGKCPFLKFVSSLLSTRGKVINFRQNNRRQFWIMFAMEWKGAIAVDIY